MYVGICGSETDQWEGGMGKDDTCDNLSIVHHLFAGHKDTSHAIPGQSCTVWQASHTQKSPASEVLAEL